jgi:hypothetical protein
LVFLELSRHARQVLTARGLGRGPARALAHIGTEILLDESLGRDLPTESAYVAALGAESIGALDLGAATEAARLRNLAQRLEERGVARALGPELVARRLRHALEPHPKLLFSAAEEPTVAEWVIDARPLVAARADELMTELRGRLAGPPLA